MLGAFCSAKSAMQQVEYRAKAREVEVVVRERQQWARRQRAICEWLSENLRQVAISIGDSQLAILQQQVPQHRDQAHCCSTGSTTWLMLLSRASEEVTAFSFI